MIGKMVMSIREEDFPKFSIKLGKIWFDGRDVYGFFLKEEEFQRIKNEFLSNGFLGPLDHFTDTIYLAYSEKQSSVSNEHWKQAERGRFVGVQESNTIKKIKKHNLPVRKIKMWHRIKWFLREKIF